MVLRKASLSILAILLFSIIAANPAQAEQRCVLVEYFTSTFCQPCTLATAILDSLTEEYPDSCLAMIRYHPVDSDPFYRSESESRKEYYTSFIMIYPSVYFDGLVRIAGAADSSLQKYQETIEARLAIPSPLNMSLSATYDSLTGGGQLIAQVGATDSLGGQDLRLRYALIESGLVSQGKRYREVLQDMFPDAEGVGFTIAPGEVFHDTVNFDLDDLWVPEDCSQMDTLRIGCVAFVQDDDTKEILQSIQTPLTLPLEPVIVRDLVATLSGSDLLLTWSPVTMDKYCRPITVDAYRVYRCSDKNYNPNTAVLLDSTTETFYLDSSCPCLHDLLDNCFYYVTAELEGRMSQPSSAVGEIDHYLYWFK
jgi:hypothetical protein